MGRKREGMSRLITMIENTQLKIFFRKLFFLEYSWQIVISYTADSQIFPYKILYYKADIFMEARLWNLLFTSSSPFYHTMITDYFRCEENSILHLSELFCVPWK